MDIPSILLGLALLAAVAFIVARPLLDRTGTTAASVGAAARLELARDQNFMALRDLDFDHATGKINDDDYQAQRATLVAQGVALLKELDTAAPATALEDALEAAIAQQRRGAPAVPATRPAALSPDAAMEAAIAQQRARPPHGNGHTLTCTQCGRPAQPGDKFCGKCGAALPTLAPAKA